MKTPPLVIATALLALLAATACAPSGAGRAAPDRDMLLDCRAKADDAVKSRYTGRWEREVQRCLDEAEQAR